MIYLKTILVLAGLGSYLVPLHYFPWTAFHSEALFFFFAALLPLYLAASGKTYCISRSQLYTLSIIVSLILITSLLFAKSSFFVAFSYLSCAALAYLCGTMRSQSKSSANDLIFILILIITLAATASVLIAIIQHLQVFNSIHVTELRRGGRPYANLAQPNNLGTLLLMGIACLLYLNLKKIISKSFLLGAIFFFCIGISLTQSRTAMLGFLILAAFWSLCRLPDNHHVAIKRKVREFFYLAAILFTSLILVTNISQFLLISDTSIVDRGVHSSQRVTIWLQLLHAAAQKPILGYGFHNVSEATVEISTSLSTSTYSEYAHNLFLDFAIWFGIPIGALLSVGVIYWLASRLLTYKTSEQFLGLAIILVVFSHSMFELPHAYSYFLIPVAIMAGIVDSSRQYPETMTSASTWIFWILGITGIALCTVSTIEYLKIEQAHRNMRFASARIGPIQPPVEFPSSILFPELTEFINFAQTEAKEDMSREDLDRMQRVAHNKAFPPALFRYALALGLNDQPEAAALELRRLRALHGDQHYEEARASWIGLTERYPQLGRVAFPIATESQSFPARGAD